MSAGGYVAPDDYERRLEAIRELARPRRVQRAPWGWEIYTPGREDVERAADLDELEAKLKHPAGDGGDAATLPRRTPPAGP